MTNKTLNHVLNLHEEDNNSIHIHSMAHIEEHLIARGPGENHNESTSSIASLCATPDNEIWYLGDNMSWSPVGTINDRGRLVDSPDSNRPFGCNTTLTKDYGAYENSFWINILIKS